MQLQNVKIVHFIPGRVRLKVPELQGQPMLADQVRGMLGAAPGILELEINTLTGSVLVRYDTRAISRPEAAEALRESLGRLFPSLDLDQVMAWLAKGHA
ncbi:MAG: HMA2 domain-containing protein [Pseudomonadota bacterium]